jgi:hypothetical protein
MLTRAIKRRMAAAVNRTNLTQRIFAHDEPQREAPIGSYGAVHVVAGKAPWTVESVNPGGKGPRVAWA